MASFVTIKPILSYSTESERGSDGAHSKHLPLQEAVNFAENRLKRFALRRHLSTSPVSSRAASFMWHGVLLGMGTGYVMCCVACRLMCGIVLPLS